MSGSHGNMTKIDRGGWADSAERDVMPKLNLWYECCNYCCHADRSISNLSLPKNEYPILTEIVEDIVEASDTSNRPNSGRP